MTKEANVRDLLKKMASEVGPKATLLATVKVVNEQNHTCDLEDDDGIEFFDVRLKPVLNSNESIKLVPKQGTWALAVRIEETEDWMLIACGEVDKVLISCDAVEFNGGTKGGLVNWPDAKLQHDLVRNFIQAMKTVLSGAPIPEPGNGAPSALQAALNAATLAINVPSFENLVDNRVKH